MTDAAPGRRRAGLLPLVALAVLALLLVAVGVVFLVQSNRLRNGGPLANKAIVDQSATSQAITQVSAGLNQVLTYDYKKPQDNKAAAAEWLTGDAPKQYNLLFTELQRSSAGQQLTTTATVAKGGVVSLQGDTAQLLMFIDEQSTRASDGKSSVSQAEVQITAVKKGSTWRISELRPI